MRHPALQLLLSMALALAACGDNTQVMIDGDGGPITPPIDAPTVDGPPPPLPPPTDAEVIAACGTLPRTLQEWEDCYLARRCVWEVECGFMNRFESVQQCLAQIYLVEGKLAFERLERERAVALGRTRIHTDNFRRCVVDTKPNQCNTALIGEVCAGRFVGSVADAAACYADVDCKSPGAECISSCTDACCEGTCQPRFREGQACTTFRSCEPGLQCHSTCIRGDIGTTCTSFRDCDPNAWCDVSAGICRADLAIGAPCTGLDQCGENTTCVGLSVSSTNPGRCTRVSEPGDRCDTRCFGGLYCSGSRTCERLPALGESCSVFLPCATYETTCTDGVCVARTPKGGSCTLSEMCMPGLFCTAALGAPSPSCQAPQLAGSRCTAPAQCESYLCSGTPTNPGSCLAWSDTCPAQSTGLDD